MRSDRVVFLQPLIDDDPGFGHGTEPPAIQTGGPENRVETLAIGVLPRTAWFNVVRAYVLVLQPFSDRMTDQFRAVVIAQ